MPSPSTRRARSSGALFLNAGQAVTDTRLRELERRYKQSGTVKDEAAWLLERVRAGELTDAQLQLFALLGHQGAASAVGTVPDRPTRVDLEPLLLGTGDESPAWLRQLHELAGDVGVRRLATSAVRGSRLAEPAVLHAVEAYALSQNDLWWQRCRNHLAGDSFFERETAKLVVIWGGKPVVGAALLVAASRLLGLLLQTDEELEARLSAACAAELRFYRDGTDLVGARLEVVRSDWWLMSSSFPDLNWARLRVYGSGVADIYDMDGRLWEFGSEEQARNWLSEDEYTPFPDLDESDAQDLGRPLESIQPPQGENDDELLPQMFVKGSSAAYVSARLADFELRAGEDSRNADVVAPEGWLYITVHPCGDEPEVLDRVGVLPEDCQSVDAYWNVGSDVAFLQVSCVETEAEEAFTIRRANNDAYLFNLTAAVAAPFVTHALIHSAMRRFFRWGFTGGECAATRGIGDASTRIEEPGA